MRHSDRTSSTPWSVPVNVTDIPDTGRHYKLVADQSEREAIARLAELRTLPQLEAVFDLSRRGEGVAVKGEVKARVGQTCVVTLEPIESEIHETVALVFAPPIDTASDEDAGAKRPGKKHEAAEPLREGAIDLGAIAAEFLILGLDPYPRKPGAEFAQPSAVESGPNPFAALAALKKQS
jgi:uncharacterized metal-binding protein YceD (DUF177 family)